MKVKIKIIEFSSDIFSRSSQLKDIQISPLFSNINFSINIFDAISKNGEYEIKTNNQIIKIGLYQGKSLLGIGEIDINKKSQKIKIASDKKNQNSLFMNNSSYNKTQDNDYYIILECINNNKDIEKIKNNNLKENKHKKKKTSSVDNRVNYKSKANKNKLNNSLKDYFNNKYNLDNNKNTDKNYATDYNYIITSNSSILTKENNNIINNLLYENKNKNKNSKENKTKDNRENRDNNDNESNEFYFNESFQKENFSDGVLILNNNNDNDIINNDKYNNNNKDEIFQNFPKMENIEINNFINLIHDFNLIYNNVNNNNSLSLDNIKDNFILEYQYFVEKTSDIFNLYSNLSNKLNKQNIEINNYIHNLNNKIKSLYKKDKTLKIKSQNNNINDLNKNVRQEFQKNFAYEIKSINNKLSLINYMNNDILLLFNNFKAYQKLDIKKIFEKIIQNEKINRVIKNDENFIRFLINNRQKMQKNLDNSEKKKKLNSKNIKIDGSISDQNDNGDNKIDIERLKNKIDKIKNQYINETIPKEHKNKINSNGNNKKKKLKEIKTKTKSNHHYSYNRSEKNIHDIKKNKNENISVTEMYNEYKNNNKYHNYYNSPSGNRRTNIIKYDF